MLFALLAIAVVSVTMIVAATISDGAQPSPEPQAVHQGYADSQMEDAESRRKIDEANRVKKRNSGDNNVQSMAPIPQPSRREKGHIRHEERMRGVEERELEDEKMEIQEKNNPRRR